MSDKNACNRLGCRHDLGECEAGNPNNQHPTHDMTDDGCLGCGVEMDAPGSGEPCPNARCQRCGGLYGVASATCDHAPVPPSKITDDEYADFRRFRDTTASEERRASRGRRPA